MQSSTSSESPLERLERVHRPEYVAKLKALRLRAEVDSRVMTVCRAWHGPAFGWPGYGSDDWVACEIVHAETAIRALDGMPR